MNIRSPFLVALAMLAGGAATAQPVLNSTWPVMNFASRRASWAAASGIAQGSIFLINGSGLGPSAGARATTLPLPTTLAGTSVTIAVGGSSTAAFVLYALGSQVVAVMPSTTPTGAGAITVTVNGRTSASAPVQVVGSTFGMITADWVGSGQAIATTPDGRQNSIIQAAHPGDQVSLWGTGLGPIASSDAVLPPAGNLDRTVVVHVGDKTATPTYKGRVSSFAGMDQITFEVPAGVQGCQVPVAVETGGVVSNIGTISVSASGRTCSDSIMGQDLVDRLASGETVNFGYVRLERSFMPFSQGQSFRAFSDYGTATFSRFTPQTANLAQYGVSAGYCIATDCGYGCQVKSPGLIAGDSSPAQLDAGAGVSIVGSGSRTVAQSQYLSGYYGDLLNQTVAQFLWTGLSYTVSGSGGADVGAFSATDATSTSSLEISNLTRGQSVSKSADLKLDWTGGDTGLQNGQVTIGGISSHNGTAWTLFQCTAPVAAKTFSIPSWVLSTLATSSTGSNGTVTFPYGWIWIGQYNNPVTFQATGLDKGILTDALFSGLGVYYQ